MANSLEKSHQEGLSARHGVNLDRILGLQRLDRTRSYYERQYIYKTTDFAGNHIPLTARTIEETIFDPVIGNKPLIQPHFIRNLVLIGDALYLEEFVDPFLIKVNGQLFLDIFPHSYIVSSNDPIVSRVGVGFVRVFNRSRNALTLAGLRSDEELFKELLSLQPDCISMNVGLADIKQENVMWEREQIPGAYVKKYMDLMLQMKLYFEGAGCRGVFSKTLTFTFNLLPVYNAADSVRHNVQNPYQAVQHSNLYGTTWYNITRQEYKEISDKVNMKLHHWKLAMFNAFGVTLLDPTPKWRFEGLHVERHSGLPPRDYHIELLQNYFFCS